MNPFVVFVFAPVAIIIGIFLAVFWWVRFGSRNAIAIKTGIVTSAIVGIAFTLWAFYAIRTSCSSTAAIGYLFLPYYIFLLCSAAYLIGWSIATIIRAFYVISHKTRQTSLRKWPVYIAMAVLVLFGLLAFNFSARKLLLKKAYVSASESELDALYDKAVSSKDIDLLAKLAKNPSTSQDLLRQIYSSIPASTFKYPGSNYSPVFAELARNKKTPSDILKSLSEKRAGERLFIAANPNTPADVLEQLARDKDSLVRTQLTTNPNVTKEILIELKNDPDKVVRSYANTYWQRRGFSDN